MNISHLVVGLIFLGIAAASTLGAAGLVDASSVRWLLPLVLMLAGGAGLAASAARTSSRRRKLSG